MPPFKHKSFWWPSMREVIIKLRYLPDIRIGATVSLDTGRPIVDFRIGDGDAESLTPAEARRVAAVLLRSAACCDAKSAAAKAWRSTPVREESKPRTRHTIRPRHGGR